MHNIRYTMIKYGILVDCKFDQFKGVINDSFGLLSVVSRSSIWDILASVVLGNGALKNVPSSDIILSSR